MLKELVFANTAAVVALGGYVICRALSLIAPDFIAAVGQSWFHTWNLDAIKGVAAFDLGTFLLGAVTFSIFAWITAYAGAWLYKKWAK